MWDVLLTAAGAMIAGFAGACLLYRELYGYFAFIRFSTGVRLTLSFFTAYAVIAAVLLATGWLLRRAVRLVMLGWLDRLGGGLIGLVKAVIISWIIVLAVSVMPRGESRWGIDVSWTFIALRTLPVALHVPGIDGARESLTRAIDPAAGATLRTTRDRIERFRSKVDSVKNHTDTL